LIVPGKPYRPAEEIAHHKQSRDPLVLFRAALVEAGFNESELGELESEVVASVQEAVQFGRESPLPDPAGLFDDLYSMPVLATQ